VINVRPIYVIAEEIETNWSMIGKGVSPYARPYLNAMHQLDSIKGNYYLDSADSVVRYFLANATGWRGETAKRIKAELKGMLDNSRVG
jgi:hypothetical protein